MQNPSMQSLKKSKQAFILALFIVRLKINGAYTEALEQYRIDRSAEFEQFFSASQKR